MLYTKSILKEKSSEDGIRISVMSRHTLNDGITPDNRIILGSYDEHLQILAPPLKLIGDYYKRGLCFEDFEKKYLEYIRKENVAEEVKKLAKRAISLDITILCIEENPEKCHRRILAEECKRYEPYIQIIHR